MTPVGYQQFRYGVGFPYLDGKGFGKMFTDILGAHLLKAHLSGWQSPYEKSIDA